MKAIFVSFEHDGSGHAHHEILRHHASHLERCPNLLSSMALEDGSRHGFIHVFASDQAAERYLGDDAFLALSRLPGCRDFFVRRFDVITPTQPATAGDADQVVPSERLMLQEECRQGQAEGTEFMGQHVVIAEYLRDLARYYRLRHAEDSNILELRRADDLERFACYVQDLPSDDVRLSTLAKLTWLEHDGVVSPGPRFSSTLADINGFPPAGFEALLDHLVHAAIDDAIDQDRSMVAAFSEDLEATMR